MTNGSPIALGLVGIGKIARDQHLPAIAAEPQFKLIAMASHDKAGRNDIGYTNVAEMIAGKPQVMAVSFATPPQGRSVDAISALDAGRHVMLEKPPCATLGEVRLLCQRATRRGLTLFASWHSREAAGVAPARRWLLDKKVLRGVVSWREDVRVWHPGQEWIFGAGGMGVFDPGINALSILTEILPGAITVSGANLEVPANRDSPIRATLDLEHDLQAHISVDLDFLYPGAPEWKIQVETDGGTLILDGGGSRLLIDGNAMPVRQQGEYPALYARFANLIRSASSDVDIRPLELVADAILAGTRRGAAPFGF